MKIILIIIIIFFESTQIFSQNPPVVVIKTLKEKFPSATDIKWVKDSSETTKYFIDLNNNTMKLIKVSYYYFWEARFNLIDKNLSVSMTNDGHWIVSKMKISVAELREEVKSGVEYYYPSCKITSVEMIESVAVGTYYEIFIKCGDKEFSEIYNSDGYRIRQ
jgi:hypothetical protein